jgi:arabinose-5-phosphate isomerase
VTDGDVRRIIQSARGSVGTLLDRPVREVMTKDPTAIRPEVLAFDALHVMEDRKPRQINLLPVVDADGRAVGMIRLHDLVQAGLAPARGE